MSFERRLEWMLFLAAFITYGWFNQGGGWNQNARFAEVRAIVDGRELKIDNYFCYRLGEGDRLRRYPVINGDVTIAGKTSRLCWVTTHGDLLPVTGVEPSDPIDTVSIDELACSGDVSFAQGHFHPNKPPGLSFAALPAYFVLSHLERWCGRNPDGWWLLNVNAWLTSVFSVGIISAAGVVLAFRVARHLAGGRVWPAFWTALAFGFGTLNFPFATLLFDHDVTAVLLLGAFYFLLPEEFQKSGRQIFWAGFIAGCAAITNYVAAVPVAMLGLYMLKTGREERVLRASIYALGLLGPFLAICAYNQACYGSPFALSNHFQNPAFVGQGKMFLGMFSVPNPGVGLILLFSPFRGIFYGAPILAMGVYGLWKMRRILRAEMWVICGIGLTFFLVNMAFFGWHAGFACGPRYLIPATAFLVLPAVFGFMAWPRLSGALLAISVVINFLFTATDAESPAGVGSLAMAYDRTMYVYSPLTEYAAPLFFQGRAWPLLDLLIKDKLGDRQDELNTAGVPVAAQRPILAQLETDLRQAIRAGSDDPLELGSYTGPVSVNPTGVCEGSYYRLFDAGSPQARWNSFNLGEFWLPESRLSLAPLFLLLAGMAGRLAWEMARGGARRRSASFPGVMTGEEIVAD